MALCWVRATIIHYFVHSYLRLSNQHAKKKNQFWFIQFTLFNFENLLETP